MELICGHLFTYLQRVGRAKESELMVPGSFHLHQGCWTRRHWGHCRPHQRKTAFCRKARPGCGEETRILGVGFHPLAECEELNVKRSFQKLQPAGDGIAGPFHTLFDIVSQLLVDPDSAPGCDSRARMLCSLSNACQTYLSNQHLNSFLRWRLALALGTPAAQG